MQRSSVGMVSREINRLLPLIPADDEVLGLQETVATILGNCFAA